MKRSSMISLVAIAAFSLLPIGGKPLLGQAFDAGRLMAETVAQQPRVQLNLAVEKQVMQQDGSGKSIATWQALNGKVVVNPGDRLRYTVSALNQGKVAAKRLIITQPVPQGMVYVLDSATAPGNGANLITYSIDNGKTFVEKPVVQVQRTDGRIETRPAPAERYTHVRWVAKQAIASGSKLNLTYQVKVR